MREVFLPETIPQKDWRQTPPPDGWYKVVCSRIKADNGLGIYIADARQKDDPRENDRNTTVILPPWADGTYHNPISQARAKVTAALENGLVIYVTIQELSLKRRAWIEMSAGRFVKAISNLAP